MELCPQHCPHVSSPGWPLKWQSAHTSYFLDLCAVYQHPANCLGLHEIYLYLLNTELSGA